MALLLISGTQPGAARSPYSFGVVPQFDALTIHRVWRPILDELETATGLRFELRGSASIPEFERQFLSGAFDFAYMNPYHVLLAREKQGYRPLVREVGDQLYGVLVVPADSRVKAPADLHGKEVAFPAPNALGASLQIRADLLDVFGVTVVPRYVNSHTSVYMNVVMGLTAAGGGVQKTLARQKKDIVENLRVLYSTREVVPHPVAAHPRIPEAVQRDVQRGLLEMGSRDRTRALLADVPIRRIGVAQMQDYEPLAGMRLERFYE